MEPPLPIPNRTVKRDRANDSELTSRESRSAPDSQHNNAPVLPAQGRSRLRQMKSEYIRLRLVKSQTPRLCVRPTAEFSRHSQRISREYGTRPTLGVVRCSNWHFFPMKKVLHRSVFAGSHTCPAFKCAKKCGEIRIAEAACDVGE